MLIPASLHTTPPAFYTQLGAFTRLTVLATERGDMPFFDFIFCPADGSLLGDDLDPGAAGTLTSFIFGAKVQGDLRGDFVTSNWDGATYAVTKVNGKVFADGVLATDDTLASATALFTAADVGLAVTGAGIPADTAILRITSSGAVVLSAVTTATGAGKAFTIAGRSTFYRVTPNLNAVQLNDLLINGTVNLIASEAARYALHGTCADGVTTNTSVNFSSATLGLTAADVGKGISGAGIPGGATIATVTGPTTGTLSAAATATAAGVALTIAARTLPAVGTIYRQTSNNTYWKVAVPASTGSGAGWSSDVPVLADITLDCQLEIVLAGARTSTAKAQLYIENDVIYGGEGVPFDAYPSYPDPAKIDTFGPNQADITGIVGGETDALYGTIEFGTLNCRLLVAAGSAGLSAYGLPVGGPTRGAMFYVNIEFAVTAEATVELRDDTYLGTLLASVAAPDPAVAAYWFGIFRFDGTAWHKLFAAFQ